jgi:hypothetical protein
VVKEGAEERESKIYSKQKPREVNEVDAERDRAEEDRVGEERESDRERERERSFIDNQEVTEGR